jgi:hypothetical protein
MLIKSFQDKRVDAYAEADVRDAMVVTGQESTPVTSAGALLAQDLHSSAATGKRRTEHSNALQGHNYKK